MTTGFLCHRSQERIVCHIARSEKNIFLSGIVVLQGSDGCNLHVVLQGHKQYVTVDRKD